MLVQGGRKAEHFFVSICMSGRAAIWRCHFLIGCLHYLAIQLSKHASTFTFTNRVAVLHIVLRASGLQISPPTLLRLKWPERHQNSLASHSCGKKTLSRADRVIDL